MTEPGLFHIMLDRVRVPEQGGASALMFLVMFACQAVAALVAGSAVLSLGYERLLGGAAVLAALAALLCRGILSDRPAATERISNAAAGD
jgi:hypothetical protein